MTRAPWYIGAGTGPRYGGKFSYFDDGHRLRMGGRHRPMTRNARTRFLRLSNAAARREGWLR